jgi:hypothetical protein
MVDFDDPAFAAHAAGNAPIVIPATAVKAAWKPGIRPSHVKLILKISRDYKMLPTGRREKMLALGDGGPADRAIEGLYEAASRT